MTTLNVKSLNIDRDKAAAIVAPLNPVIQPITLYRGNEYLITANCYSNSSSNTFSGFSASDDFVLFIGRQFNSNANPVVVVQDAARWNNVADWSSANVAGGMICVRANISGTTLDTDLANVSSKSYHMEIVVNSNVMASDLTCYIYNAVQK